MYINLVDSSGDTLDYAEIYVDLKRYYGDRTFHLDGLNNAFDVTVDRFNRLVDEDQVTEPALKELIELSSFSVEYKASDDDRFKKLHRLMYYANGLTCGRISRDDGHSTFNGFTREIQSAWNLLLGICFKRGLNEETEKIVNFVNNKCDTYYDYDEHDTQILVCSAPRIEIFVSYNDPDIDERMVEPIDVAVLSCTTIDEHSNRVSFRPERLEFDKEEMQRYLRLSFGLLFQKYIERNGLKVRDTVIQTALIEALWRHFEEYVGAERVEHDRRNRRSGNLYYFTNNEQPAQVATEIAAEV